MSSLKIDGIAVPEPAHNGLTFTKEPIWSSNTGRGATGKMLGDIIGYKFKLQIKWPALSQEQTSLINQAINSKAFFDVEFIDPTNSNGDKITKSFYAGTPTYPVYSYVDGLPRYVGVGVDLIEQ